jgi:hypothetical protein
MQGTRAVHRQYIPLHQRRAKMHGYTSSRSTSHACREVSRKCQIGRDTVPLAKTNESIDRGVASVETTGGHVRGCAVCTARTCICTCAPACVHETTLPVAQVPGDPPHRIMPIPVHELYCWSVGVSFFLVEIRSLSRARSIYLTDSLIS